MGRTGGPSPFNFIRISGHFYQGWWIVFPWQEKTSLNNPAGTQPVLDTPVSRYRTFFYNPRNLLKKILHKVFSEKFLPGDPKNFPDSLLPVFLKPGKKYIYTGDAGHAAGFLSLSGSAIADHR